MCKLKNKTLLIVMLVLVCLLVILAAAAGRPLEHGSSGRMMTQINATSFGAKSKAKAVSSPLINPQAKGHVPPGGPNPCTNTPNRSNGHC